VNLFAISSVGFQQNRLAIDAMLDTLAADRGPMFLKVDAAAARDLKHQAEDTTDPTDLAKLVRQSGGDYVPDEQAIAEELLGAVDDTLVLDCSAYSYAVVQRVIGHMRIVLFSQAKWPCAIALVLRDELLDVAVNELASAFYMLPSRKSQREASTYAYRVHKVATFARLMQWSHGATGRAYVMRDRFRQKLNRLFKRDETDLV